MRILIFKIHCVVIFHFHIDAMDYLMSLYTLCSQGNNVVKSPPAHTHTHTRYVYFVCLSFTIILCKGTVNFFKSSNMHSNYYFISYIIASSLIVRGIVRVQAYIYIYIWNIETISFHSIDRLSSKEYNVGE